MPSSMVHLLVAHDYNPDSPAEFWAGNIAPDCIAEMRERERFHLRDMPDRERALREFEASVRAGEVFAEGVLLHLFTDWKWDEGPMREYILSHDPDNWHPSYRDEIGLLSARLYHDNAWSKQVWADMLDCDIAEFVKTDQIKPEALSSMLRKANAFHLANPGAQPAFYSAEAVAAFASETADTYRGWRKQT